MTKNTQASLLARFDQHPLWYSYLLLGCYLLINNSINATSVWMEHSRNPLNTVQLWEPFLWEYSSALSTLLLCPFLHWMFSRHPMRLTHLKTLLLTHLLGSLVFSVAHVTLMVGFRSVAYSLAQQDYGFGPVLREFFYEYRKDVWGYLFFFGLFQLLQFVYRRLKGEASLIQTGDDTEASASPAADNKPASISSAAAPRHFLVKKLDKEFLIAIADIEWLEASGNYVNLHSKGRIYPLRATLSHTMEQLTTQGFSRIHRSFAVNHHAIDSISYQPSGDGEIQLKNGQKLALSRRYKDDFRAAVQTAASSAL
ncbi:LytR/AlgR family response regulator transcription factor [Rheinheimera sp.]|uniref:LytR/AlgR family response regulator transcription factor n=1 Tax=Rheinheimera sp. TaxID=1869214 RepID=UPI002FDEFBD3